MSLYSDLYFLYFFENLPVLPLLIKLAALGNMKVTFIALICAAFSR